MPRPPPSRPGSREPLFGLAEILVSLGIMLAIGGVVAMTDDGVQLLVQVWPVLALASMVRMAMGAASDKVVPSEVERRMARLRVRSERRRAEERRRERLIDERRAVEAHRKYDVALHGQVEEEAGPEVEAPVLYLVPVTRPEASCSYCGDTLGEVAMACATCETPHHTACWRENAGCTVYACDEAPVRRPALSG